MPWRLSMTKRMMWTSHAHYTFLITKLRTTMFWESSGTEATWAGLCPIQSNSGDASWKSEGLVATNPWKISSNLKGDVTITAMNGSTCMYSASTGTGVGVNFYKDKPASNVTSIFFEAI
ncbi:hypothetical protein M407DRAFT_232814 [Tulasnella calospora MUT 4182]|uniref:Uncharacterized protein n=1 Tax=Tulasnella calospora MUT 4182 TaxID=1051891 RepID=A0A0C3L115_9AGAM|nr:hypothetical protein M407DRAFT_232814 [Tulasnella calospora MUT 4182]